MKISASELGLTRCSYPNIVRLLIQSKFLVNTFIGQFTEPIFKRRFTPSSQRGPDICEKVIECLLSL